MLASDVRPRYPIAHGWCERAMRTDGANDRCARLAFGRRWGSVWAGGHYSRMGYARAIDPPLLRVGHGNRDRVAGHSRNRVMIRVPENQLQGMATRLEVDCRFRLSAAKMEMMGIGRNRLIGVEITGIDKKMVMPGIFAFDPGRGDPPPAQAKNNLYPCSGSGFVQRRNNIGAFRIGHGRMGRRYGYADDHRYADRYDRYRGYHHGQDHG